MLASIPERVLITRMGIVFFQSLWPEGQSILEQDGHRWRLLPWGSGPFGEISPGELEVQPYLSCTIRSQGFAPSQRFAPVRALWLCFTPLPPIGFRSSELFPLRQPRYLSVPGALLSLRQRRHLSSDSMVTIALAFCTWLHRSLVRCSRRDPLARLCEARWRHPALVGRLSPVDWRGEWPAPSRGLLRGSHSPCLSPSG